MQKLKQQTCHVAAFIPVAASPLCLYVSQNVSETALKHLVYIGAPELVPSGTENVLTDMAVEFSSWLVECESILTAGRPVVSCIVLSEAALHMLFVCKGQMPPEPQLQAAAEESWIASWLTADDNCTVTGKLV